MFGYKVTIRSTDHRSVDKVICNNSSTDRTTKKLPASVHQNRFLGSFKPTLSLNYCLANERRRGFNCRINNLLSDCWHPASSVSPGVVTYSCHWHTRNRFYYHPGLMKETNFCAKMRQMLFVFEPPPGAGALSLPSLWSLAVLDIYWGPV